MIKICVTNENFAEAIRSMRSKEFNETQYRFLVDSLSAINLKYLINNDLPKNKLLLYGTENRKNKILVEKYKHQFRSLGKELAIYDVLNKIFEGKEDRKKLIDLLNEFNSKLIIDWLEHSAEISKNLALKVAKFESLTYTKYFRHMVVYELYGLKCKAVWRK